MTNVAVKSDTCQLNYNYNEMFIARKKEIEANITGLENESRELNSRLAVGTLTAERIKDIYNFAACLREYLRCRG